MAKKSDVQLAIDQIDVEIASQQAARAALVKLRDAKQVRKASKERGEQPELLDEVEP